MNAHERAVAYFSERRVKLYILRRNDILALLETLSGGTTPPGHHDPPIPHAGGTQGRLRTRPTDASPPRGRPDHESKPPPGVLWRMQYLSTDRPPPKWRSLFHYYLWRFEHEVGANLFYGDMLCTEAEKDYVDATSSNPYALEGTVEKDRRILSAYRGQHPLRAAITEGVTKEHMIRLRRENHLDPLTGLDPELDDPNDYDPDPLMNGVGQGAVEMACDFLLVILADGPRPTREVVALARERHIIEHTLKTARKRMGVVSNQGSHGWVWSLPSAEVAEAPDHLPQERHGQ
jgi:hypothetical protein